MEKIDENTENQGVKEAMSSLEDEFTGTGIELSIEPAPYSRSPYRFNMTFPKDWKQHEGLSLQKAGKILKENGLELGRPFTASGKNLSFEVNERLIGNIINWRRWLPNPDGFSKENTELLDRVAEFVELQEDIDKSSGDSLHKFTTLVRLAHSKGLITEKEFSNLQGQYYSVAN